MYMCVYIYIYIYTYAYTYTYIYKHTHIHIYIYIYVLSWRFRFFGLLWVRSSLLCTRSDSCSEVASRALLLRRVGHMIACLT